MVYVVGPSEDILPLLPAWRERRRFLLLMQMASSIWLVQNNPARLKNRMEAIKFMLKF
jgi:hypothetical protein